VPRFFCPALPDPPEAVALPEEEAAHLRHVLRLEAGDLVHVFDGRGREFAARIESVRGSRVIVQPLEPAPAAPEPSTRITLAQAVLKADHMDHVIRDATMMGVAEIQPVVSARTETSAAALARGHRVARWTRIAVAASKQSGRAVVPVVRAPCAFDDLIRRTTGMRLLLVEPRAAAARPGTVATGCPKPDAALLAVGPEGGWTSEELVGAEAAGFDALTLGGRTLRADAAPIVALAVLEFLWDDL
jgi:16S rRNA (uracil1498-N3)-methyltransferase